MIRIAGNRLSAAARRLHRGAPPNVPLTATTRALWSTCSVESNDTSRAFQWWATGAAAFVLMAAAGTVSQTSVLCESKEDAANAVQPEHNKVDEAAPATATAATTTNTDPPSEEEDPYANLPDDDEETTCSMCNTFRKGPCRQTWRKLERCFKDHEDQENGSIKCMPYFNPHSTCLMKYTNLYHLISLDMKGEFVRDTQLSVTAEERQTWAPVLDWSSWIMFVGDVGLGFQQTLPVADKTTPLWQRLPENTEPVLITVTSKLPKVQEESGLLLKAAYAVDQDGMVLGFTFSEDYGEKLRQVNATDEEKEEERVAKEEKAKASKGTEEESIVTQEVEEAAAELRKGFKDMAFDFFLLPGSTTAVRVCALYAEDPVAVPADKDILDVCLLESVTISLADVIKNKDSAASSAAASS